MNFNFRFLFLPFILLFGLTTLNGQTMYTTQQLLREWDTIANARLVEESNFLTQSNQSLPLVEKMEFRLETDEWDLERQEYLFRTSFNSRKMKDVQEKITNNYREKNEIRVEQAQNLALLIRYEYLIDWYFLEMERKYLEDRKLLLQDHKSIIQAELLNAAVVDLDKLLSVEEDIQELDQNMLRLGLEKDFITKQLIETIGDRSNARLDTTNWISIAAIQNVLNSIKDDNRDNLEEKLQKNRTNLERLNYESTQAESKKWLDFAQIKYAGRDNLEFEQEWSLGLGINIPSKSKDRIKKNEILLDVFDEEWKLDQIKKEKAEDLEEYYAQISTLFLEYQFIEERVSNNELAKTYQKYQEIGSVPPSSLLRIKENLLKNNRELEKIEKKIFVFYLNILSNKGLLFDKEKVNYLSNDLSTLN